jgi:hypothetical protein
VTLKKLIKSVARLIDMRGEMDMTERAERAEKIQGFAQELGIPVNVDHLESLASFDGPELVAQMVGGATASIVPPLPHEAAASAEIPKVEGATDEMRPQAVTDTGLPIEPRPGDTPLVTGTPEDIAEVRTGQPNAGVRPTGIPAEPTLPEQRAVTEVPAEPTLKEQRARVEVPAEPMLPEQQAATEIPAEESAEQGAAEKPSLIDGIEAFFQRVAKRLDDHKDTDHPDDKE